MGLDTTINMNLWKDKAVVEMNVAVLHSFQVSYFKQMENGERGERVKQKHKMTRIRFPSQNLTWEFLKLANNQVIV